MMTKKNSNIKFMPVSFEADKDLIVSTNLVNRNLVDFISIWKLYSYREIASMWEFFTANVL